MCNILSTLFSVHISYIVSKTNAYVSYTKDQVLTKGPVFWPYPLQITSAE